MDDLISRQDAIDALSQYPFEKVVNCVSIIEELPSAQPEIVRCKDCKYRDENWRRVSVRWLPCMDVRTGSNWYCGSAERKDDE